MASTDETTTKTSELSWGSFIWNNSWLAVAGLIVAGKFAECPAVANRNGGQVADDSSVMSLDEMIPTLEILAQGLSDEEYLEQSYYAIIINGDRERSTYEKHDGRVEQAYGTFRAMGFLDENIYIFSRTSPRHDNALTITASAEYNNIKNLLHVLQAVVDPNDFLWIYTTGHGVNLDGTSGFALDHTLYAHEDFVQDINILKPGAFVVVEDQCYSGGVLEHLSKLDRPAYGFTSVDGEHTTYCETFSDPLWEQLSADPMQMPSAFCYAAEKHSSSSGIEYNFDNISREAHTYDPERGVMSWQEFCTEIDY